MAQQAPTRYKVTAQEYLEQYPETNQPMELIDGEITVLPTPKDIHQKVSFLLSLLIGQFVVSRNLGEVRVAPADLHLDDLNVVQPDIYFIAKENEKCHLKDDGYWHGTPDLCIEILSPSTAKRDRSTKFNLYAEHGVREYWLVEPDARFIEVYVLENNAYVRQGIYDETETFTSSILSDLDVNVQQIFPST